MAEFESDLLSEGSGLDQTLVRACKKVAATMLLLKRNAVFNEMAVKDAILLTYEDVT